MSLIIERQDEENLKAILQFLYNRVTRMLYVAEAL
jgi:hypothetical protein